MKNLLIGIIVLACVSTFAKDIVIFDADKCIGEYTSSNSTIRIKDGALDMRGSGRMDFLGRWDLSKNLDLEFEIENKGKEEVPFRIKLCDDVSENSKKKWDGMNPFRAIFVPAGFAGKISFAYPAQPPADIQKELEPQGKVRAMRATPFSYGDRDTATMDYKNINIVRILSYTNKHVRLKRVVAKDSSNRVLPKEYSMTKKDFFPFIDKYGQYKFREWEGKVHTDADLLKIEAEEEKDLATHKGAPDRSKFGGWLKGERQKATGHFYVKKIDGKWWLVDPEGYLFWSHGVVRVTPSCAITPLDTREFYFEGLPKEGEKLAQFYTTQDELLAPYYTNRGYKKTYDFSAANIFRKYGDDWRIKYAKKAHRRLQSWGLNTIANSSDKQIFTMSKTPYIERFEIKAPSFRGEFGAWWPFRDPFNPKFTENVRKQLLERKYQLDDPYCIGMFIDNEIHWGSVTTLAGNALLSESDTFAKIAFIEDLKKKYSDINKLNKAWRTSFSSWDALLKNKKPIETALKGDLKAFNDKIVDTYFRVVRDEFKKIAPHKMYMGCRFAGGANEVVLTAAAKYCDAVSFNSYKFSLANLKLPFGLDKPIIIGEFHFGAIDRGPFHCGLIATPDQKTRAQAYYNYVKSALENHAIIGTHWHQFSDQAATGRFDGENFQVGFTDVCDRPYPETIAKIREIGYDMYKVRDSK